MKMLVTGGAGAMGSDIVNDLVSRGIAVRVLDKKMPASRISGEPAAEFVAGGIEDRETVESAMSGIEVVYHLADTFSSEPYEVLNCDIKGTINLLEAAVKHGVSHFLFTSTFRVYGKPEGQPVGEDHPLKPEESGRALYATAKLANEKLCLRYWHELGLPVTIFRFWWSFGIDIGGKALRSLIDTALQGGPIRVPERGGGSFLSHADAVSAFRRATLNERVYGKVLNLSSGTFTPWHDLAALVLDLTGSSSLLEGVSDEKWQGDAPLGADRSIAYACDLDIKNAERLMGYRPAHTAAEVGDQLRAAVDRLVRARRAASRT